MNAKTFFPTLLLLFSSYFSFSQQEKDYSFCWGSYKVTLYGNGAAKQVYVVTGKTMNGQWKAYGSPGESQRIKITFDKFPDKEVGYTLLKDGNGKPSVLVDDAEGRNYDLCGSKNTEYKLEDDVIVNPNTNLKQFAGNYSAPSNYYQNWEAKDPKAAIIQCINNKITLTITCYDNSKIIIPYLTGEPENNTSIIYFKKDNIKYEIQADVQQNRTFNKIKIIKLKEDESGAYFNVDFYRNINIKVPWDYKGAIQVENCQYAREQYLIQNPDVKKAGVDPWTHYNEFGKKEGRKWPPCK